MENKFIKNRKGQKISVLVEFPKNPKGLAFIMHGLGGFKEIPMIAAMAEAFLKKDIIAFRFDTTNSFGESDGTYELATTTNYYEDLEDVINWAKKQPWYVEPFYLIGHSTGAVCLGTYAKRHPKKIKGLAPLGGVSGELWLKNEPKEGLKKWNETGWKITPSSKPGTIKKLNWHNYLKDSLDYDLLKNTERLTMPILLITGEKDNGTPPRDQNLLFDKLPAKKEQHVIKNAPHVLRERKQIEEMKRIIKDWIERIETG